MDRFIGCSRFGTWVGLDFGGDEPGPVPCLSLLLLRASLTLFMRPDMLGWEM